MEALLANQPPWAIAILATLAVAVALIQALVSAWRGWRRRRRMSLRMRRAAIGEERAAGWLEKRGFEVIGAQVAVEHPVRIDGRTVSIALRADYLAQRDGRRYVVEVKTGALAPRLETSATRRQLLEYRIAFDVDGVVLVDGETGGVHEITFPALARPAARAAGGGWRAFALVLAVAGAVLAIARFS